MTETPFEDNPSEETASEAASVPDSALTRDAVYDEAELRFVDAVDGETASKTASRLNKGNKVGRADGKSGNRYVVRKV